MTPTEARNALMARYLDEFTGQFPIALDNQIFERPNSPTRWVRFNVQFNDGNQDTLGRAGNRKFLKLGLVFIQIFTPVNEATNANDGLANDSLNLMDAIRIDDLWTYNGRIETVGSDGEYYQQNAVLEFEFEDIR